jgi:Rhamnan synthesis protein F
LFWSSQGRERDGCERHAQTLPIPARLRAFFVNARSLKLIRTSPLFDQAWYLASYPEVAAAGVDPALHYLIRGAAEHRDPGPMFDTAWYLEYYCDVARAGINPLVHYIRYGVREGRHRRSSEVIAAEVAEAAIKCRKQPPASGEIALFVTHSSDGRLKAHARYYLEALCRHGISPVLIVAADGEFSELDNEVLARLGGFYLRQNVGYDFAAWAHVLRIAPQLWRADILYLINDSTIGPLSEHKFEKLLQQLRASKSDIVGLTDSHEQTWHIQSYFLALKRGALLSEALKEFIGGIKSLSVKRDVINTYELRFASTLRRAGLSCDILFPTNKVYNPSLVDCHCLVAAGLPFIKLAAIRDGSRKSRTVDWQRVFQSEGFDPGLAEQALSDADASLI